MNQPYGQRRFFHTATTDGRGCDVPPSGQWDSGLSALAPSSSPGCWTDTSTKSSATTGPQVSAPWGTVRNCLTCPRSRPSTGTANRPSLCDSALPSVEIHRLPLLSNATLSGQEMGLTCDLS